MGNGDVSLQHSTGSRGSVTAQSGKGGAWRTGPCPPRTRGVISPLKPVLGEERGAGSILGRYRGNVT